MFVVKKKGVKRLISALLVAMFCLSSLMAGSLAWTSFSQRAQNMVLTPGVCSQAVLEIHKTVQNDYGGPLTAMQRAQQFAFIVTFSDDGAYTFTINGGNPQQLASGGTLYLRHGESAIFSGIPVGVTYTVVEAPAEGFQVSSTNHQATITGELIVAHFVNTALHGRIVVTKTVVSDAPDSDEEFAFTATIGAQEHHFSLPHNGQWVSEYFPVGTPFVVLEHANPSFITTPADGRHTGYIAEDITQLPFINTYVDENDDDETGEPGAVQVRKLVGGGQSDEAFEFQIVFSNLPDEDLLIVVNGEPILLNHMHDTHTFTLTHDELILFEYLPAGTHFLVAETPVDGFHTGIRVGDGVVMAPLHEIAGVVFGGLVIEIDFINEIHPLPENNLVVTKTVEGDFPAADAALRFRFRLQVEGDQPYYFYLAHGESRRFTLPAGVTYTITELVPENYWLLRSYYGAGSATRETIYAQFINQYQPTQPPPAATTTQPGATTTQPGATTTQPGATTTPPGATTTLPGATTTQPGATTTQPGATTTQPGATTTQPGATTTQPGATTTQPGATTTPPGATTTPPGATTMQPGATTTPPGATTTPPGATTTPPGATTTQPGATTTQPGATTTQPGATTTPPGATTTQPGAITTPPGAITTQPIMTTAQQSTTSAPSRIPQTGVEDNFWLWLSLLVLSLTCAAVISRKWLFAGRKHDKHLQKAIEELFETEE